MVEGFRNRRLEGVHPYLWLDATYHKIREDGRVQGMAMVVASPIGPPLSGSLEPSSWSRTTSGPPAVGTSARNR